jgi:NAD(P)H-dependent FMN reductase
MTPPHIQIIIGSIREGRVGEPVARWFAELAAQREDLTSELVDLREWNLPFLTLELLGIRRVFGINRHPSRPNKLSQTVSIKAGED